jgi:hypothetical protein
MSGADMPPCRPITTGVQPKLLPSDRGRISASQIVQSRNMVREGDLFWIIHSRSKMDQCDPKQTQ